VYRPISIDSISPFASRWITRESLKVPQIWIRCGLIVSGSSTTRSMSA